MWCCLFFVCVAQLYKVLCNATGLHLCLTLLTFLHLQSLLQARTSTKEYQGIWNARSDRALNAAKSCLHVPCSIAQEPPFLYRLTCHLKENMSRCEASRCTPASEGVCLVQAVHMLHEEVGSLSEGSCGDMLVLPIYAALPPELQACYISLHPLI